MTGRSARVADQAKDSQPLDLKQPCHCCWVCLPAGGDLNLIRNTTSLSPEPWANACTEVSRASTSDDFCAET
jgi:hypothetical protein